MSQVTERWLFVPGYEGRYEVSDQGRVRSYLKPGAGSNLARAEPKVLGVVLNRAGYPQYNLVAADKSRRVWLGHHLVLLAFVGPCPAELIGCHNDGNPANAALTNLRWDTYTSNSHDRYRHGTAYRTRYNSHCVHGHEWTDTTTGWKADGKGRPYRYCRECSRIAWAAAKARRRG